LDLSLDVDDRDGYSRYQNAQAAHSVDDALKIVTGLEDHQAEELNQLHDELVQRGEDFLRSRRTKGANVTLVGDAGRHPLHNGVPGAQFDAILRKSVQIAKRLHAE